MTVVEYISKLDLLPVIDVEDPALAGLFVKAHKTPESKRSTGFLISGIRFLQIERPRPRRVRTRISWGGQNDGTLEIEENGTVLMRRNASILVFQLPYDKEKQEYADPLIIRGNATFEDHKFVGRGLEISWEGNMVSVTPNGDRVMTCKIKRKQKSIEITLEEY